MRALTWHGKEDIRCETVPDPTIQDGRDAIVKVTACAICGSDLHLMGGFVPTMQRGDVLGHECMGEVVEVGRDNAIAGGSGSRWLGAAREWLPLRSAQSRADIAGWTRQQSYCR